MRFYSVLTCELWSSGEIVSCDVRPNGKLWADEHIYDKRELVLIWSKIILRKNYYFFQVFLMLWTCIKNYVMRMLYEGLLPLFKQCCNTSAQHWRDWLSPCFFCHQFVKKQSTLVWRLKACFCIRIFVFKLTSKRIIALIDKAWGIHL